MSTDHPDPEVPEKPKRRRFSTEYKRRILAEADAAPEGGVGALLRREGLYWSHLLDWRRQRDQGTLGTAKPGRPARDRNDAELERLRAENRRLRRRLRLGAFAALDQRIALRYHLGGMDLAETAGYVKHHLALAGRSDPGRPAGTQPDRLLGSVVTASLPSHDRDEKFTASFDEVFTSEGVSVIRTLVRASRAKRVRRAMGADRPDRVPGLDARLRPKTPGANPPNLRGARNRARPHRGLYLATPEPRQPPEDAHGQPRGVRRQDVLGGLIHEYEWAA